MFWLWLLLASIIGIIFGSISCRWDVFALMFTATILIWYSVETRGLRLETQQTNRLSTFPALTLRYEMEGGDWVILLGNIGKGPALNPKIEVLGGVNNVSFSLEGMNAIPHDIPLKEWPKVSFEHDGRRNDQKFLTQNLSSQPLKVKIIFSSARDSQGICWTELELKNPREIKILATNWI